MFITAVILAGVLTLAQGTSSEGVAALEAEAEAALTTDAPTFDQRAALVDRIDRARGTSSGETAARLALLWLRGVKWMFSSIPLAERDGEPHNAWIRAHQDLVAWSEPAGEWILAVDVIWKLHDQYRGSKVAEPIAWIAVENGLPGGCEGYIPCYAVGMNQLDGEYLRRHPQGTHLDEVIERVKGTFEQALSLAAGPDGQRSLDPATDCGDMKAPMKALRAAIAGSPATPDRDRTLVVADEVLALCP